MASNDRTASSCSARNKMTDASSATGSGSSRSSSRPNVSTEVTPSTGTNFEHLILPLYKVSLKILLLPVNVRISFYFCLVTFGSIFFDFFPPPVTYFSNKYHFLNMIFVKKGWGWTLFFLMAFLILSTFIYCAARPKLMHSHLMRLLVGSSWWYIVVSIFHAVENSTGQCFPLKNFSDVTYKPECRRMGGIWIGFDISGHTFLLILCSLWIVEECQILRNWDQLTRLLQKAQTHQSTTNSSSNSSAQLFSQPSQLGDLSTIELFATKRACNRFNVFVKLLAILLCTLSLMWDLMLVITVLYYHNLPSKFTGMLFALFAWFFSYRLWFPRSFKLSPGLPGDGPIRLMALRN